MPSKYGGIPVEEQTGSKFGGQAVDKPTPKRTVAEAETEQPGVLDTILKVYGTPFRWLAGGGELAATMGTAALAQPVSGLAGIAGAVLPGERDQSARWIENVQQGMTYQPRGEVARGALSMAGETVESAKRNVPFVKEAMEAPQYLGRAGQKAGQAVGGPGSMAEAVGGAIGASAIPMAMELIGLKGTKAAKKAVLKDTTRLSGVDDFYDAATGAMKPEIKTGIKEAGLSMDDIKDILPENIQGKGAAEKPIEKIAEAATARPRQTSVIESAVAEVKPDPVVIDAAREFGVLEDIPASWTSQNPTYQAIEQGLKIPGSAITETEQIAIKKMADQAQSLIREFGGSTSKSAMSGQFRADSIDLIDKMGEQADALYSKVREMVDVEMPATAPKTLTALEDMARKKTTSGEVSTGLKRIPKTARNLLVELSQPDITYDYLDSLRKEVGDALHKKAGPLKDENRSLLKMLYSNLTKDQEALITDPNALSVYKLAKANVAQRKGIEEQLIKVIGKDLEGDIATTAKQAVLALQDGRTKEFNRLANNIPKELGKDARRQVFATSLVDVMTQGSKKEKALHMTGFDNFMTGLKREPSNWLRFEKELGPENMQRLKRFHDLAHAGRVAMAKELTTGKSLTVPRVMDEITTVTERLYGVTQPIEKIPGGGTAKNIIGAILNIKKTPRSEAADKLLGSAKFRNLVMQKAQGNLDKPKKIENVNKLVEKLKSYQQWKKSLDQGELSDLAKVGAISYLTEKIYPSGEELP